MSLCTGGGRNVQILGAKLDPLHDQNQQTHFDVQHYCAQTPADLCTYLTKLGTSSSNANVICGSPSQINNSPRVLLQLYSGFHAVTIENVDYIAGGFVAVSPGGYTPHYVPPHANGRPSCSIKRTNLVDKQPRVVLDGWAHGRPLHQAGLGDVLRDAVDGADHPRHIPNEH